MVPPVSGRRKNTASFDLRTPSLLSGVAHAVWVGIITRTAHSGALIVRGTGYEVDMLVAQTVWVGDGATICQFFFDTVRARPPARGVSHSKSVVYGAFVLARRAQGAQGALQLKTAVSGPAGQNHGRLVRTGQYTCGGKHRARSHCHFVLPLIHFIPRSLTCSAPLLLKRQCDRTLGKDGSQTGGFQVVDLGGASL